VTTRYGIPGKSAGPEGPIILDMDTTSRDFAAGRPRRSGPIRAISRVFGPIGGPMAGRRLFPLWAIVRHTGRTSGTAYATPVVALRTRDGFFVPLPFGDATQWAKNVFAAGGATIRSAGREYPVVEPQVVDREAIADRLPRLVRFASRRMGLRQFIEFRVQR
jgi:deazaflavin-dependent oxidoreductase (nitroreductase family)